MSSKKRKVLGRGLGALLKPTDSLDRNASDEVTQLNIDSVELNSKQPRQSIDEEKLEELARSIKSRGIIQPILVRPRKNGDKKYEVVAGERRLLAAKLAGFQKIPALVKFVRDEELLEIALIENIQRDDLNPIEESRAYQRLLEEKGYTQDDLARRIGKKRSTVANLIRLLQLPESIRDDVAANVISSGHARALLSLKSPEERIKARNLIVSESLSVRKTEEMIRELKQKEESNNAGRAIKDKPAKPKVSKTKESSPQHASEIKSGSTRFSINACRQNLSERFAANVSIRSENGKKGKIELDFNNPEDFQRIYSLLLEK